MGAEDVDTPAEDTDRTGLAFEADGAVGDEYWAVV